MVTCSHLNYTEGNFCGDCGEQLQQRHDLKEETHIDDEFECMCKYPTFRDNKLKDSAKILEFIELGYKCEFCGCKMTPRPEVPNEIVKYNRFKILAGLFGASVAAGLIAVGIYYPMKVLNRYHRSKKRKTKKNRRSKIKK